MADVDTTTSPAERAPAPPAAAGALVTVPPPLPAPVAPPGAARRRLAPLAALLLALAVVGGWYWWQQARPALPAGIASGNGRLEADEIDVATKLPGRVAELRADEGDLVKAGQVLARMDTRDLEASLGHADATVRQAGEALRAARADLDMQASQMRLAGQELDRAKFLAEKSFASRQSLDQRQSQLDAATAAHAAAEARVRVAEHALEGARRDVDLLRVNIADATLVAPRDGRVQYRLANVGEVLPAGGKVFTTLDVGNVYMDIFLPTADAGRARVGSDARIVLDALPDIPIPARVSFVAAEAQFTPKAVETRSERDKLMFRVRVRVDPDLLRAHAAEVRTGLPGVAYVRLDPAVAWPAALQGGPGG